MATNRKLYVAFVWHMHQPFYKDLVTDEYILPWTRLHAIKDYYDMIAYLDDYPKIKAVFNVVPSLLVQLEDYANDTAKDKFLELTKKAPEDLSADERSFILKNFFMCNWETMIKPYERYQALLLKRGRFVTDDDIAAVSRRFSSQEMLDLQVWFNLTWFGAIYKNGDPVIMELLQKGAGFNDDDKKAVIEKQKEIIRRIIPKYKEMQDKGQVEISVTPFYHPILPLLCDSDIARVSSPGLALPKNRINLPQDAKYQVEKAVSYYKEKFGTDVKGMWPSEGSVSDSIVPLVAGAGIKWIATDEEILGSTLHHKLSSTELFCTYSLETQGTNVSIIFRDHRLSDDLGFVYSRWEPQSAAADIISKLHNIADGLPPDSKKYLVSIILDGENAWEYYSNNGRDFFDALYRMLSADERIETVRVKDFLDENPPLTKLHGIFPGSWINHNFNIWIGHAEDNAAWDYLSKARDVLAVSGCTEAKAWEELYIAEGSDWNWWYGDDHSSDNDEDFDKLFRKHLMNIYHFVGRPHPKYLESPIKSMKIVKPSREPVYLIEPVLDGEVSNYYEWLSAGQYSVDMMRGAMHQRDTVIKNIYYGFSLDTFYVRIDPSIELDCGPDGMMKGVTFEIDINKPFSFRIELSCLPDCTKCVSLLKLESGEHFVKVKDIDTYGVKKIIEVGVLFSDLNIKPKDEVNFTVALKKDGKELERWPKGGLISFNAPDEDFEASSWFV